MNGNEDSTAAGTATATVTHPVATSASPTENRELLTFEDVANLLQVHADTVQAMSRTGKMPRALKLGYRTIRFRRADISDWIRLGCKSLKAFEAAREVERQRDHRERSERARK